MASKRLVVNGGTTVAPDGVITVFTIPFTVSDPINEFWAFTGEPGELETNVSPAAPSAGEFSVVGQTLTYGTAPTRHNLRYFTTDVAVPIGDVAFIDLASTGDKKVWTLPTAPRDQDSIELFFGEPGALIYRVDSSPGFNEYTISGDLLTVTLGLDLEPTSELRATIIEPSKVSALVAGECDSKAFYEGLQATAARLIKKYGVSMVLTQTTTPAYDPQTNTTSGGSTSVTFKGAAFPIERYKVDGETILGTDKQVLAQIDAIPKVTDVVSVGGIDHIVAHVGEIAPGCVPIVYDLAVRG